MPFRKNLEREKILLRHWRQGETVKAASFRTGIPEGTISHYYARFNKNKDMFQRAFESGSQEPPRSTPFEAAAATYSWANVVSHVMELARRGEYDKARDYLQMILLVFDLGKRLHSIMFNFDPEKRVEVMQNLFTILKLNPK